MGVKLAAASGGSIELVPTNTASAFTVTVPAVTGTMLTNKTAGTVLQVVNATTTSSTTTSSSSFVTTSFSLSITPSATSSKVYITLLGGNGDNLTTSFATLSVTVYRGGTNIGDPSYGLCSLGGASRTITPLSLSVLDSPATTSSTTYTVYVASTNVAGSVIFNGYGSNITLTAMEIAA